MWVSNTKYVTRDDWDELKADAQAARTLTAQLQAQLRTARQTADRVELETRQLRNQLKRARRAPAPVPADADGPVLTEGVIAALEERVACVQRQLEAERAQWQAELDCARRELNIQCMARDIFVQRWTCAEALVKKLQQQCGE
jgi:hypothetical protein